MAAYFDYNATAPQREEVVAAMVAAMSQRAGNPSSMHDHGRRARRLIDEARVQVARLFGVEPRLVLFTSGATEANNLVLRGFAASRPEATIVTTVIEHASVLATVDALERAGHRVVRLPVSREAQPDWNLLAELTRSGPCLVVASWANGETGHITDVDRLAGALAPGTQLHLDAAQAAGRVAVSLKGQVGSLACSAHKFGGPNGVGALIGAGMGLVPILTGGPQEWGLRAGTENVAGIVGMGVAAELCLREMKSECSRLAGLREQLWTLLCERTEGLLRISPPDGLPNTLTVAVAGLAGDVLVAALDMLGFSVSTGSACAAGAAEPSHVVEGLGIAAPYRDGVVRISMGRASREEDVVELAKAFADVVARARKAA